MTKHWALIPAAGIGRRMGSDVPKQYLKLGRQTVLEHTLEVLYQHPAIDGMVLVTGAGDGYVGDLRFPQGNKPLVRATGGDERCHSVLNGLDALEGTAAGDDWVLVHDAARPCLRPEDVSALITGVGVEGDGGLLAIPVRDTMKRQGRDVTVDHTVDRDGLWHALTPQMFRYDTLRDALRQALAAKATVTDEASAIELINGHPRLVEGHSDNIKITRPEDLALAGFYLQQQGRL